MISADVTIENKLGLHARASSKFTQTAAQFQSEIWVSRKDRRVNGKSIMGLMMLAAGCGSRIQVMVNGADEDALLAELEALIAGGFTEGK